MFKLEALCNGKKISLIKTDKLTQQVRIGIQETTDDGQKIIFDQTINPGNIPPPPPPPPEHQCPEGQVWSDIDQKCIEKANNPPRAQSFSVETFVNDDIIINLMGSDMDIHDTLTYIINKEPEHGTLSIPSGNRVTYTPESNYEGTDSFNYSAYDQKQNSNVATVSLKISPDIPPPPPPEPGKETVLWTSKLWANGHARKLDSVMFDPDDPQMELRAGDNRLLVIDGKGTGRQSGPRVRQYVWNKTP